MLKNRQSFGTGLVSLDKDCFAWSCRVEGLQRVQLRRVVVPVQLLKAAVLVTEHAVVALMAILRLVEVPAVLSLEGLLVG